MYISCHQESTALLPHLCSQMLDSSNSSHEKDILEISFLKKKKKKAGRQKLVKIILSSYVKTLTKYILPFQELYLLICTRLAIPPIFQIKLHFALFHKMKPTII